ncbi:MAG: response regulator [Rivularia sp. (in: Bacteria)]|nr:response regulator [Rivularia sp. MS3]
MQKQTLSSRMLPRSTNVNFLFTEENCLGANMVLIADEEEQVRDALSVAVHRWAQEEQRNVETIKVENGQQTIDSIHHMVRYHKPPTLVIADLRMPDMSGVEVAEIINRKYAQIPIVITASYDENDENLIQKADDFADQYSHVSFIIRTKSSPLLKVVLESEIKKILSKPGTHRQDTQSQFGTLRKKLSRLWNNSF